MMGGRDFAYVAGVGRRRRLGTGILFGVLVAVVLVAQIAVIAPEFWQTRLWEDEAYNLTVPLNLLAGHGYAGDGILAPSGTLTLFDPRISTGAPVLLPVTAMLATGIDPVIGARAVMLLFYAALLVGLWFAGRRVAGRWGGLVALAVPLALDTNQLPSPVQGPVDVLGEIPAAAALVFAFLFVQKRPWLGGLMLGLAVQIKLISGLAAPALLLMVLFAEVAAPWRARIRRAWPLVIWAVIPTVLYELVRLVTLLIAEGVRGYIHNTMVYGYFVLTGGQFGFHVSPGAKLFSLVDSWFVPVVLVVGLTGLAVLIAVIAIVRLRMLARARGTATVAEALTRAGARVAPRSLVLFLGGVLLTLLLWCAWWSVSAHTPDWIRYAVTGLLLGVPILAAALVLAVRILWVTRAPATGPAGASVAGGGAPATDDGADAAVAGPARASVASLSTAVARALAALTVAVLVVTWGSQAVVHAERARVPNRGETLVQQRAAARAIARLDQPVLVTRWGGQVGVIVLSGARAEAPVADPHGTRPEVLSNYELSRAGRDAFDAKVHSSCSDVLLRVRNYAVCTPAR